MEIMSSPCWSANSRHCGARIIVPSSLTSSAIAPAWDSPASRARSTAASVWPARRSTPPGTARSGNTWPGRGEVERLGGRVGEHADGVRAVGCGDAGGDAVAGIHRHGVGRALAVLVDRGHRGQVQTVELRSGQRHADHAGGVADHERHLAGGGPGSGEDQVALVLAVLVVDHHDAVAAGDGGDGVGDRVQPHPLPRGGLRCPIARLGTAPRRRLVVLEHLIGGYHGVLQASSDSTYLAVTSTSRFTASPTVRDPSVVSRSVVGISDTVNQWPSSSVAELHHGQRDAVNGYRAFRDQVSPQRLRESKSQDLPLRPRGPLQHRSDAVHVALHDVPAEPGRWCHGAFQIHRVAGAQLLQRGAPQRLGHHVGAERGLGGVHHGQADAVHRDGVARGGIAGDQWAGDAQPCGVGCRPVTARPLRRAPPRCR